MGEKDAKVCVSVPGEVIENQMRLGIMQALSKDTASVVKAVVEMALMRKSDRYEDRGKTVLQLAYEQAIHQAALDALKEYLEKAKPQIKKAVRARIESTEGLVDAIADRFVTGIGQNFAVSIRWKGDE